MGSETNPFKILDAAKQRYETARKALQECAQQEPTNIELRAISQEANEAWLALRDAKKDVEDITCVTYEQALMKDNIYAS